MTPAPARTVRAFARHRRFTSASPAVKLPCFIGINIPTREELLASRRNVYERRYIRDSSDRKRSASDVLWVAVPETIYYSY
ncbi:hypothetical protein Q1695_009272 [Nippostrongylus brasiliensis]|nr:hypothetical protein Q1695_009272 [Nippostrongylus brasiliensis]